MRRAGGRSIANVLIFAALGAEFIVLAGHALFGWGNKTYPPTPIPLVSAPPVPPSGSDVLLRLSAEAASQSSPPWPASRPYAYIRVRSWALRTHHPQHKVVASTTATWHTRGQVPALSASGAVLARLLAPGTRAGGWAPGWTFVDLARLTQSRPVPGAAQAILLRILSAVPGVVNAGTTIDRAGRAGAAVSLDSSYSGEPITYTLIFDQATGSLLESDETLSDRPHKLDALKGSVVAYTTFLRSGYAASQTAAP
jgi:hypothetical protein